MRTEGGDVYAGRDGSVYKKQGDAWQKYDGTTGNWGASVPSQEVRDQAQQRAQNAQGQAGTRPSTTNSGTAATRPSTTNSGTVGQLDRDSAARSTGTQRTRDYGTYGGSSSTSRSSGSYRPSGGGMRMGGGGRRR